MSKIGSIGIDVGGTKTRFGLFDSNFNILKDIKLKTQDSNNTRQFTAALCESLDKLHNKALKAGLDIACVGVGCAGTLSRDGTIRESLNIPFLKGYSFRSVIAKELGTNVTVINDVAAGLYGEHRMGAAVGRRHVIGVFIGTGISAAIIIDGKLYLGAHGTAGDIGHYHLHADSVDGSRRKVTLNKVASRSAIVRDAADVAAATKLEGKNGKDASSSTLAEAIAEGDEAIEKFVRGRCHILGTVLSNLVDFLNPEMLVLGGGLTEAMPGIVRTEIESAVRKHSKPDPAVLEIVVAKLKEHAVTTGAAAFALDASLSAV
jgi:glucokinase